MDQIDLKTKNPSAAVLASVLTVLFITAATISADLIPAVKTWLAHTFTHHWIGKGVLSAGVFAVSFVFFGLVGGKPSYESLAARVRLLSWLAVLGTLAIFGFFLYETYLK